MQPGVWDIRPRDKDVGVIHRGETENAPKERLNLKLMNIPKEGQHAPDCTLGTLILRMGKQSKTFQRTEKRP